MGLWEETRRHNLIETQQLYGKLLHTSLTFPPGRAYFTSLEIPPNVSLKETFLSAIGFLESFFPLSGPLQISR